MVPMIPEFSVGRNPPLGGSINSLILLRESTFLSEDKQIVNIGCVWDFGPYKALIEEFPVSILRSWF